MILGIGQEITNHLCIFATDPRVRNTLIPSENQLKWNEDCKDHNIFISVPEDRLEQYGGVLAMMLTQLIRTLERRQEKYSPTGKHQPPILLMLDEFPRLGKMEVITSAVSTLRSKGVTICLVMQSLAQLDLIYGENIRRIILENCPYKAVLNADDTISQEYLSKLVGTIQDPNHSLSRNYDSAMANPSYSYQVSESHQFIIQPHEFSSLKDIVLLTPIGYCRIDKVRFYEMDEYKERLSLKRRKNKKKINRGRTGLTHHLNGE